MNEFLIFGMPQGAEWLVILVAVLVLFGGSRLPQLAKSLGQSKKAFREGMAEAEEEERLDKAKQTDAEKGALKDIDDEALFEEARRRARLRAGENAGGRDDNLLADKSSVERKN